LFFLPPFFCSKGFFVFYPLLPFFSFHLSLLSFPSFPRCYFAPTSLRFVFCCFAMLLFIPFFALHLVVVYSIPHISLCCYMSISHVLPCYYFPLPLRFAMLLPTPSFVLALLLFAPSLTL
jgi:hypothetical protein